MIGVIAVPFFDTPENQRGETTRATLRDIYYDLDPGHTVVPVDNGSTDLSTWEWLQETFKAFPLAVRLEKPQSVAYAVNVAWRPFENVLLSGDAVAVKCDSDWAPRATAGPKRNWLARIIEVFEQPDPPGLLGPTLIGELDWRTGDVRDGWEVTTYVRGTVVARSPECFRAIGYCRHPGDVRWGWQDHWDCFRARRAELEVGVLTNCRICPRTEQNSLPEEERTRWRAEGRAAYVQWIAEVIRGERGLYEEARL